MGPERILLIGDADRHVRSVVEQAMPVAQVQVADDYFSALAELSGGKYSAVLAAVEPIERRPDAAVRALREVAPETRLILYGHPTLEPLSRKMLELGCDDYLITPTTPGEVTQVFGSPVMRIAPAPEPASADDVWTGDAGTRMFASLPLAELVLHVLAEHPHNAIPEAIRQLNQHLSPTVQVVHQPVGAPAPVPADGLVVVSQVSDVVELGQVHLLVPRDEDLESSRRFLSRLAGLLSKLHLVQQQQIRLQKLAVTDELTGLYNTRYFRHFLGRIIERAKEKRFPVTLLIFDIDNFKKYNDQFGHAAGDQILRQTAALMKRCCREHDVVARIGGDEFAVVFWEKDGPRQPREPRQGPAGRAPQTPLGILDRFRKLLAKEVFSALGSSGQGVLTISGGMAVYPFDARGPEELIEAADRELMFKAKQAGKNSIFLVGSDERIGSPQGQA